LRLKERILKIALEKQAGYGADYGCPIIRSDNYIIALFPSASAKPAYRNVFYTLPVYKKLCFYTLPMSTLVHRNNPSK